MDVTVILEFDCGHRANETFIKNDKAAADSTDTMCLTLACPLTHGDGADGRHGIRRNHGRKRGDRAQHLVYFLVQRLEARSELTKPMTRILF